MGITERRQAEREIIKEKIFNAASEILIAEGYEKLSIRKIAEKIEYSPAVIYNYFKDKNDVITAIIAANYGRICEQIKSLELPKLEPEAALRKGFTAFIWLMTENRGHYKAIVLGGVNLADFEEKNEENTNALSILIEVLDKGIKQGVFEQSDAERTAQLLLSAGFGLVNTIVSQNITDQALLKEMIEEYTNILVKGVLKHE